MVGTTVNNLVALWDLLACMRVNKMVHMMEQKNMRQLTSL